MTLALIATIILLTFSAAYPSRRNPHEEACLVINQIYQAPKEPTVLNLNFSILSHSFSKRTHNPLVQSPQEYVDEFVQRLNGYTKYMNFAYWLFEKDAPGLEVEMNYTTKLVHDLEPPNNELMDQIEFAQKRYKDMVEALSIYRGSPHYNNFKPHSMLKNLAQMNVCLATLYKQNGTPDLLIDNYENVVNGAVSELEYAVLLYGGNDALPAEFKHAVKLQLNKVQKTIDELRSHLPSREKRSFQEARVLLYT